jgi:hypothetical protein
MTSWFSLFRCLILVNVWNFLIKRLCASIDAEAGDTPFLKKAVKGRSGHDGTQGEGSYMYRVQHMITGDLTFSYYCIFRWFPILQQYLRCHGCACPAFFLHFSYKCITMVRHAEYLYIDLRIVMPWSNSFSILKRTIITRNSYSPNVSTMAWLHRPWT